MFKALIRSLALLLALSPVLASAQQFPSVPDKSVIGRIGTGSGSGPSQAIPFTNLLNQLLALISGSTAPRIKLTTATTFYVATTGSDSNSCVLVSAPCLTIQHAYNLVATNYDMAGQTVTIQIADGTYTGGLIATQQTVGQNGAIGLQIVGNLTTPSNVVISTTAADCFTSTTNGTGSLAGFFLSGMKLQTTTSGNGISSWGGGSYVIFGNLNFGTIAGVQIGATHGAFVIQAGGAYSVSGNSINHASAADGATIALHGAAVTFSNSPAFAQGFVEVSDGGHIYVDGGMTFVNGNTVTGQKFQAISNGVITATGFTVASLPGSNPGSVASGGLYVIGTAAYSLPGQADAIATSATLVEYQRAVFVDATSGPKTITVPTQSNFTFGTTFSIIKIDSSANAVTVVDSAGGLFIGATTGTSITLRTIGAGVEIKSDASNWLVTWNTADWSGNAIPVASGGTGAATAAAARTNLGLPTGVAFSNTAPTISSGFGGGTPTISAPNGTVAFRVTIGTASGSTGVLAMPTAANGWNCFANNITTHTAANSTVVQTAGSANSVTLTSYSDITGAATWVAGDVIAISCFAF